MRAFAPDGREHLIVGAVEANAPLAQGWLRASHRKLDPVASKSYQPVHVHDEIQPLTPGEIYELQIEIWPTCFVFPKGYRLVLIYTVSNVFSINPLLYRKLPFDAEKDLKPVAPILGQGGFVVVPNDLPVTSMKELAAYAKQNPGKLAYASYGTGSAGHLATEHLKDVAGIQMLHIPYKGSPMTDVISGRVQLMLEPAGSAIPMIKSGKVRAIAFTGEKRHAQFPDLATMSETFPGVVGWGWHGLWAPAGVPDEIIKRMNAEVTRITQSPDVAKVVAELGSEPITGTPESMNALVSRDKKVWAEIIRAQNITLD